MMHESVQLFGNYQYDPQEVEYDWTNKILPNVARNGILQASFAVNPEYEDYTYFYRPVINPIVKGTIFERVLNDMPFLINRSVFIILPAGFCLRHHNDPDNKYHLSVIENRGSFYYDYDKQRGYHLPADGRIRQINSAEAHHTAVNGGIEPRTHFIMTEYVCDTVSPSKTYGLRVEFDYANSTMLSKFDGIQDIRSTIEQNFMMPFMNEAFYDTKKVWGCKGSNTPTSRVYDFLWTDRDAMMKIIYGDNYWKAKESLKEFGITLNYEVSI
jgi:hypothetical protein